MRFLKRLLRITFLFLVLAAIGVAVLYHLATRMPAGYAPLQLTQAQRAEAARRVETQKIPQLLNMAADVQRSANATMLAQQGKVVPSAATKAVAPLTISFTQDEINASLWKWSEPRKADFEKYLTNPFVALEDGAIVLMGTLPEYGKVASAYFQPKLDENGLLHCEITSLKLGSLPLPQALISKQRKKVETKLKNQLPEWQQGAKIDDAGVANGHARAAGLGQMVLKLLDHQGSRAVVYLPRMMDDKSDKSVPVRLTNISIANGSLTITVEPMEAAQRAALLEEIRPATPAK